MQRKICSKCLIEKDISEFYIRKESPDGYRSDCKQCFLERSKKKYLNNQSEKKEKSKKYYYSNKEKILEKRKESYKHNIDKIKEYKKKNVENIKLSRKKYLKQNDEKIKIYKKNYRKKNRKKIREYMSNYNSNRVKNDFLYRISINIRSRIRQFLKQKGIKKNSKTFELIGCSPNFLKEHLEKQFTEGMSWDLMGRHIHIDHKIPLSSAKNEEEVYKLCHYTNLQPMWAKDNLTKGAKLINN